MNDSKNIDGKSEQSQRSPLTLADAARIFYSQVLQPIMPSKGQRLDGRRSQTLARRRYQKGTLILRGKHKKTWVLRWREDVQQGDGRVGRVERKTVLGTIAELPTRKLAQRRAEQVLARVNSPDYRAIKTATFGEFVEVWKSRVLSLRKPYTQKSATYHLRVYLLPAFHSYRLDQIDAEAVQAMVSRMKVGRHTVLNAVGTLRSILGTAKRWAYLVRELSASDLVLPEGIKPTPRFFNAEQARRIIERAEQPWKTMFAIAAMTGLRPGELLGLTLDDLDLERQQIHVRRSASFGRLITTKTRQSESTVPIPVALGELLAAWLPQWNPNPERLLFATRSGRPHTSNKISEYRLKPLIEDLNTEPGKSKIPYCGLNGFRHTHASLLLNQGASPVVAQRQLRHADPLTTLRNYAHIIGPEQRDAVERVADILRPSSAKQDGQVVAAQ